MLSARPRIVAGEPLWLSGGRGLKRGEAEVAELGLARAGGVEAGAQHVEANPHVVMIAGDFHPAVETAPGAPRAAALDLVLLAAVCAVCACASPATPTVPPERTRERLTEQEFLERYASCDVTPIQRFRGERLDADLRRDLLALSGASSVRLVGPRMDESAKGVAGRLTVEIGANGRILNFYCE